METTKLKKFAQEARQLLMAQVSARMDHVLAAESPARRESPKAVQELEREIAKADRAQVVEKVAYTWFNRFTALRFMDVNGYTSTGIVSPAEGRTRPEILADAAAGVIDEDTPNATKQAVQELLEGRVPSQDPQGEAYRLLLVAACNQWHGAMPFLFEKIADYTELLTPADLLSTDSILARLRDVMTEDACQDVEIIGWLYQFYISEKKDQVFAGLKKNQKITAENIPAATQLFTPHWIVRYLVENSLGRLWLLNNPHSGLAAKMDYYIAPEEPETDFLKITKPEEIRICDPAAGSGHMLTYAFDLLYAIYEEEGYDATEIPALILTHNLTGVEIDDRAGALAAFALAMKAAAKLGRRRFLRMSITSGSGPNICVLQNVAFTEAEMQDVAAVVGKDLFTDELRETLGQFEQAKNFGSLIVPKLRDPAQTLRVVEARDFGGDLLLRSVQERVIAVLRMAEALSPKYHVVVANPPYMGSGGMNDQLKGWAKAAFPDCWATGVSDLFALFMDRSQHLLAGRGFSAMVTMQSWMFLPSYELLRKRLLESGHFCSLAHLENGLMGIAFGTVAAIWNKGSEKGSSGIFFSVGRADVESNSFTQDFSRKIGVMNTLEGGRAFCRASEDFSKLPAAPLAFWISDSFIQAFQGTDPFGEHFHTKQGLATGKNDLFVREWAEVSWEKSDISETSYQLFSSPKKWFPYSKGGEARRWYGNNELFVNWEGNGHHLKEFKDKKGKRLSTLKNLDFMFQEALTWTLISNSSMPICVRSRPAGFVFDTNGMSAFPKDATASIHFGTALLNSRVAAEGLKVINPTMAFQSGDIARVPYLENASEVDTSAAEACIQFSKSDWDAYETSWDFTTLPLLSPDHRGEALAESYATLRAQWQSMTDEMLTLEEENNRIFIDAYGLQDELTPEVPIEEITLTCNPAYRYGIKNDAEANETRLRADTMAEFLSYAVGCMFGRYSFESPGLILANQGERLEDYLARIPEPQFMPDEDNVIPVLDADWFPDDITERFRLFLRTTFGEPHFRENLRYIEDALGKDIRKYFTKDFYADHVKRYKKRPIYWMFSSPKGSFNALIYMHRYRGDTVSVVLNDYLRDYISKLESHRAEQQKIADNPGFKQGDRTRAQKEVNRVAKVILELREWERDVILPLAQQKIEIDLDDGVKANYPMFGTALKKIAGLS